MAPLPNRTSIWLRRLAIAAIAAALISTGAQAWLMVAWQGLLACALALGSWLAYRPVSASHAPSHASVLAAVVEADPPVAARPATAVEPNPKERCSDETEREEAEIPDPTQALLEWSLEGGWRLPEDLEKAQFWLNAGADPNEEGDDGDTAFVNLVLNGAPFELLKALVQAGADCKTENLLSRYLDSDTDASELQQLIDMGIPVAGPTQPEDVLFQALDVQVEDEVLLVLLGAGAPVQTNDDDETLLQVALAQGASVTALAAILQAAPEAAGALPHTVFAEWDWENENQAALVLVLLMEAGLNPFRDPDDEPSLLNKFVENDQDRLIQAILETVPDKQRQRTLGRLEILVGADNDTWLQKMEQMATPAEDPEPPLFPELAWAQAEKNLGDPLTAARGLALLPAAAVDGCMAASSAPANLLAHCRVALEYWRRTGNA